MKPDRCCAALIVVVAGAVVAAPAMAQKRSAPSAAPAASEPSIDRADLDRSQITGNRELPKVLYIVPWKKPGPGDLAGRPLVSVLDEALSPVDRDVFRRQVSYDSQMQSRVAGALPNKPTNAAPTPALAPALAPTASPAATPAASK